MAHGAGFLLRQDEPDVVVVRGPGLVALGVTVVAAAQRLLVAGPIRALVVVPIMLLLPGWLAWVAVFGRRRPADPVVAITFAVALGMGVLIVNGLVVNTIGVRLSAFSLVAGPGVISCALLAIGRVRGADPSVRLSSARVPELTGLTVAVCCALAVAVAAVTYAAERLPNAASPPFTEVSFAPTFAQRQQPLHVVPGQHVDLPIEVRLHGVGRAQYHVVTSVDGARAATTPYTITAPLWKGTVLVIAPSGRCLHQVRIVFEPQGPGAKTESLNTYISISQGPACGR